MNDLTFDNRGFSLLRAARGVTIAMLFIVVTLALIGITGPIIGVILSIPLIAVLWKFRAGRHARTLERQPTTDIARMGYGYVEVAGAAESADERELRDPVEHQPCLWFGVETLRREEGDGLGLWLPFKRAASSRSFVVRDATGTCLVDPRGAQLVVEDCVDVGVSERIKHRVWRIRAGDVLTVVGEATTSGRRALMQRPRGGKTYLIAGDSAT